LAEESDHITAETTGEKIPIDAKLFSDAIIEPAKLKSTRTDGGFLTPRPDRQLAQL
jgi:hypothetical protein